jgi:hypothetical protein
LWYLALLPIWEVPCRSVFLIATLFFLIKSSWIHCALCFCVSICVCVCVFVPVCFTLLLTFGQGYRILRNFGGNFMLLEVLLLPVNHQLWHHELRGGSLFAAEVRMENLQITSGTPMFVTFSWSQCIWCSFYNNSRAKFMRRSNQPWTPQKILS